MSKRTIASDSLGRHMLLGSAWMIGLRWAIRLTGVVSTIILARLLTPSDYGIVAMAMIFVGMLEILNQTGQKLAIIRHPDPTRADYDTAWTISVIVGLFVAASIAALAPVTRYYFSDPRVVPVMEWLALRAAISGFENIGVVNFRRDLQFHRFFYYNVTPKLVSFVITILLAVLWRNYWALVAGILVYQLVMIGLSFVMHPYRPRFSLSKFHEMWFFSFWTLFKMVGNYLNFQVDQIAVGGVSGSAAMGRYSVASDVAASPSKEINDPVVAVLYPVMAAVQDDARQVRALYLRTLAWSAIICASTSVGVTCVSHDMVHVLLGPKWTDVEPLVGWLALSAGMLGLSSGAYTTFDAIGKPHLGAQMQWMRLILLTIAIAPVAWLTRDLQLIAATRFVITVIFMPNLLFVVGRSINVSPGEYFHVLWRPLTSAAAMAAAIEFANMAIPFAGVGRLLLDVLSGCVVYVLTLLGLWLASGRPETAEADLVRFIRARFAVPVSPRPARRRFLPRRSHK